MAKYQCYYNETIMCNDRAYIGKEVLTECFDNEADAEIYCRTHVGIQGDIENEMNYKKVY